MNAPFFSILILCWNSNAYIHKCLQSLQDQTFKDFEVVLVDNGSTEPIPVNLCEQFPDLVMHYERLEQNLGFAGGNNYAAQFARGEYLVLLNSDAFPQANWLAVIREAIRRHPSSSFASRLIITKSPATTWGVHGRTSASEVGVAGDFGDVRHLQNPPASPLLGEPPAPERLDGEGDTYHATGIVWRTAHGRLVEEADNQEREVFSACGAAAVYPKQAYRRVGGFDEDYFAYSEDVDLGFRLRLAGIRCVYLPAAVVYHIGSGSTSRRSDLSVYYGNRNLVWTFFKDMPGVLLVLLLPGHVLMNLGMILLAGTRKQGRVTYRSKRDALAHLSTVIRKRSEVQKLRNISILSLVKVINWNPLSPLIKLFPK